MIACSYFAQSLGLAPHVINIFLVFCLFLPWWKAEQSIFYSSIKGKIVVWISGVSDTTPLHRGQLGPTVGFPSMWLEIYPVRMEFQPLDGNPSSGWKFHQGLVRFPTICPKMAGWKSNHPLAKARPEISRSFMIPQCKVVKWECIWASLIC